jgi:hypothetical protein
MLGHAATDLGHMLYGPSQGQTLNRIAEAIQTGKGADGGSPSLATPFTFSRDAIAPNLDRANGYEHG